MDTFYLSRTGDSSKISGDREIRKLQRALHDAAVGSRETDR